MRVRTQVLHNRAKNQHPLEPSWLSCCSYISYSYNAFATHMQACMHAYSNTQIYTCTITRTRIFFSLSLSLSLSLCPSLPPSLPPLPSAVSWVPGHAEARAVQPRTYCSVAANEKSFALLCRQSLNIARTWQGERMGLRCVARASLAVSNEMLRPRDIQRWRPTWSEFARTACRSTSWYDPCTP